MLTAFIINLQREPERWSHMQKEFLKTSFTIERVPAIDGQELSLPIPGFDKTAFRRFHGRHFNVYEVACYFSHLKAIERFLQSGEEYSLIGEDDLTLSSTLNDLVDEALHYRKYWDILRLTGLSSRNGMTVAELTNECSLSCCLSRLKGAGAYIVSKRAAIRLKRFMTPMFLPLDHAIDREWFYGLRALYITPFPISQQAANFKTSIQPNAGNQLGCVQRLLTTYTYQMRNELSRYLFRFTYGVYLKTKLNKRVNPESLK
ncbi:MAG: hypothetical protein GKR87_13020 [Kiritimatiellae bacterium]|nr:hypothetical protein [Kiritimatiellia bacterium]